MQYGRNRERNEWEGSVYDPDYPWDYDDDEDVILLHGGIPRYYDRDCVADGIVDNNDSDDAADFLW